MVRWAADLISKYSIGYDGKSPYERIRGERSKVPIAMFGELKTAKTLREQAQPKMKMGVWLGVIERTEESLIGTEKGVVKCRTVNRMLEKQTWNRELILKMRGDPWSPIPGIKGDHVPVEIKDDGSPTTIEEETTEKDPEVMFEEEPALPSKPTTSGYKGAGTKEFHVKKPMIQKYGYTEGCPACQKLNS